MQSIRDKAEWDMKGHSLVSEVLQECERVVNRVVHWGEGKAGASGTAGTVLAVPLLRRSGGVAADATLAGCGTSQPTRRQRCIHQYLSDLEVNFVFPKRAFGK